MGLWLSLAAIYVSNLFDGSGYWVHDYVVVLYCVVTVIAREGAARTGVLRMFAFVCIF